MGKISKTSAGSSSVFVYSRDRRAEGKGYNFFVLHGFGCLFLMLLVIVCVIGLVVFIH